MQETFLSIDGISKQFENHLAVDNVSLQIPRGKIYGLLGPNGAGKTTIIRMITGIMFPDSGEILFDGQTLNPSHARRVGYMPEERGLYKKEIVRNQITYLLALRGLHPREARKRADAWLHKLGLAKWAKSKVVDLSKGMQQKVQFISTVAHEPDLLILDEPFSGLDPVNTQVIEDEIMAMKDKGVTIIFSTHRMEQVEELCDHIALINQGKVMIEDQLQKVRKQFQRQVYRIEFIGDRELINQLPHIEVLKLGDREAMVKASNGQTSRQLMTTFAECPLEILKFELHLPRLQDIFIEMVTGKAVFED